MAKPHVTDIITSTFKLHGLLLRKEASQYLTSVLDDIPPNEIKPRLRRILDAVQSQQLTSGILNRTCLQIAVQSTNLDQHLPENIFVLINVFQTPRFTYMPDRKKFLPSDSLGLLKPKLFAGVDAKANVFRERYTIIHQRLLRHELFAPTTQSSSETAKTSFQLKPIEYLIGSSAKLTDLVVFGMITQIKEGKFHLEDMSGVVELNLEETVFHHGLFTEGSFVLAQGWYDDRVFHIVEIGFPPIERADKSRNVFGNVNTFGGPSATSLKNSLPLLEIETSNNDASFVFISDIWLDNPKVLKDLRKLFEGYTECPPIAFILMGNFTCKHHGIQHAKIVKSCFEKLSSLLSDFPVIIENSQIVLLPGPTDPGLNLVLPRPTLPHYVTADMRLKIPNVLFATNPARIQYCTQELVILREDVLTKMCRNSLNAAVEDNIALLFAKTMLAQSHLCPLPLNISPVCWSYDYALRLYPIPDVIICADKHKSYTVQHFGCTLINPGSFSANNATFMVYFPATRQVEESRIPNE